MVASVRQSEDLGGFQQRRQEIGARLGAVQERMIAERISATAGGSSRRHHVSMPSTCACAMLVPDLTSRNESRKHIRMQQVALDLVAPPAQTL